MHTALRRLSRFRATRPITEAQQREPCSVTLIRTYLLRCALDVGLLEGRDLKAL